MRTDRGQSEVIGEVLLVGALVLAIGIAGSFILGEASPETEVSADIEATVTADGVSLVHQGGESVAVTDLRVRVAVNGSQVTAATWENGTVDGDADDRFEPGERWTYTGLGASDDARVSAALSATETTDGEERGTVLVRAAIGSNATATTPTGGSPPVPDAGPDVALDGENGETVALDGTGTAATDGDSVTYRWQVVDADGIGGSVELRDNRTATPTFEVTKNVTDRDHDVTVELRASDPDGAATDTADVTVRQYNEPPTADAGPNRSVPGRSGQSVELDGSGSSDPEGDSLSSTWSITDYDGLSASDVTFSDRATATPTVEVNRNVDDRNHTLVVEVTVDDGTSTDTDTTNVTVAERIDAAVAATPDTGTAPLRVDFLGLVGRAPSDAVVDFSAATVESYSGGGGQDVDGNYAVEDGGRTLELRNNTWKRVDYPYSVTGDTVISADFESPREGEIHAIGLETDNRESPGDYFQLYGTQDRGFSGYDTYSSGDEQRHYDIRVDGSYARTAGHLLFVNDHDSGGDAVSRFTDVMIYDEDAYTYEWDWNDDGSYEATGKQPTHTFSNPGSYEVTLRVTAPDGRRQLFNRTVDVGRPPQAAITYSPSYPRAGQSVSFGGFGSYDPDGGSLSYGWEFGDGTTATGPDPSHTYASPGQYQVNLTVTDDEGATGTTSTTVNVTEVVYAVNSGGRRRTIDGVSYRTDRGRSQANGGSTYETDKGDAIGGTSEDPLYRSVRFGDFRYDPSVSDGEYRVTLKFAEIYWGEEGGVREGSSPRGDRVFDVLLEGTTVEDDLDIYARLEDDGKPGSNHALVLTYTTSVSDGSLDIQFVSEANNANVNAVVVERLP